MKKLILLLGVLCTGCYHIDYQNSVTAEFPESKIFNVDNNEDYIVITKDSLIYYVSCDRLFSTKPSNRKLIVNLKEQLK